MEVIDYLRLAGWLLISRSGNKIRDQMPGGVVREVVNLTSQFSMRCCYPFDDPMPPLPKNFTHFGGQLNIPTIIYRIPSEALNEMPIKNSQLQKRVAGSE